MLDWEFQWGRLRMGLFCRELLPPASAQLPVLGNRLWLLQGKHPASVPGLGFGERAPCLTWGLRHVPAISWGERERGQMLL